MRRQPTFRTENLLRLALDEIERLKADVRRFSDGSGLVITTPTTGSGPTDGPPTTPGAGVEPLPHVLYGSKHTRSLRVTAGTGLNIDFEQGQEWMGGVFYAIAAGSLLMTDAATNYVFVNTSGVVAANTSGFPSNSTPLAEVVAAGGIITSVADRRSYLAGGVHGAGITLGNPLEIGIDDTEIGIVRLWGGGAGSAPGGQLELFLSADHDAAIQAWYARAEQDDLRFLTNTASVDFRMTAEGQLQIGTGTSAGGLLIGGDVHLYRHAANIARLADGDGFFIAGVGGEMGIGATPNALGDAMLTIDVNEATRRGLLLRGIAAQSVDYIRVVNSAVQVLMSLSPDGADGHLSIPMGDITVGQSDARIGILTLFGDAPGGTSGGLLQLEVAADYDDPGVFEYWSIQPYQDDLNIATQDGVVVNTMTYQGQLQLPVTGSGAGLLIGGDVQLYRAGAGQFLVTGIGDSIIWVGDTSFGLNYAGGNPQISLDINDYWVYTRATNTLDFLIGGGVQFSVAPDMATFPRGGLAVGTDDSLRGTLTLFGPGAGVPDGAELQLYLAADHDAVFNYWGIDVLEDDLRFFSSDGVTVNKMTAEGQLQVARAGAGAGLLLGGDAQLYRSAADILRTPDSLTVDGDILPTRLVLSNSIAAVAPGSLEAHMSALVSGVTPNKALTVHFEIENESGGTGSAQWRWGRASVVPDLDTVWYLGDGTNNPVMQLDHTNGRLTLAKGGVAAGFIIGGDVHLYRSAADVLTIPDQLTVQQQTLGNEVQRLESIATNDDPRESVYQNRATTTDATVTTLHTVTIPATTTVFVEVNIVARRTGGTGGTAEDGAAYIIRAAVKNVAGTATLIGAVDQVFEREDQATWDATIDVTGATARVRITGAADNNITWHATVRTWQLST
jgi:hypothetical protein